MKLLTTQHNENNVKQDPQFQTSKQDNVFDVKNILSKILINDKKFSQLEISILETAWKIIEEKIK